MHDTDSEFDRLDRLMGTHPPPAGTADFPKRVMHRLAGRTPVLPIWQYPIVQWLATAAGLWFVLGRLLGYIFSAWLSIQLAG